jgi:proteasome assembly chaperone (PAC2) family protein
MDVLITEFDELAPLHRPILVLALRGLFDIAEVATDAVDTIIDQRPTTVIASLDPDVFYDFTQERPCVEFDEDGERQILWPENEFRLARFPGSSHDLVLLRGVEPHLRYATYADAIIEVARQLRCEMVVTLGAAPEACPHTRAAPVVGSSTNDGLVSALALSRPRYQGVTGLVGVLQQRLDAAGIPAVSLRVGVPHYLGNAKHPASSASLLQHLEHVLGVSTGAAFLGEEVERWRSLHDEAVADDPHAAQYVAMLEADFDRQLEAQAASADTLADDLERFLREQRDDPEA